MMMSQAKIIAPCPSVHFQSNLIVASKSSDDHPPPPSDDPSFALLTQQVISTMTESTKPGPLTLPKKPPTHHQVEFNPDDDSASTMVLRESNDTDDCSFESNDLHVNQEPVN